MFIEVGVASLERGQDQEVAAFTARLRRLKFSFQGRCDCKKPAIALEYVFRFAAPLRTVRMQIEDSRY